MDEEIDQLALKVEALIQGSSRLVEHNLQLSTQIKTLQSELVSLKGNMREARERVASALARLPASDLVEGDKLGESARR